MRSGHIRSAAGARSALVIAATLLAVLLSKSRGQQLYIDQAPMNTTVFLGKYAAFRCSSVSVDPGSSTILWFMNETLIHHLPQEYDASSVSSQRTDAISGENSTLTVLGSEQTNGTQYRCGILDPETIAVVNYSALVTLTVQGIPYPPTGLQLNSSFSEEHGTYVFKLTWTPSRTLFGKNDSNRQEPNYVVYIRLNSSSSLLNLTETTSSSNNITLKDLNIYNVSACNLSTVRFYVSAKFEEIGEGNVSSPVGFNSRDADDICMAELIMKMMETPGGLKRNKNNSQVIAASVGTIVGVILLLSTATIVVSLIILYKKRKELKMELSTNDAYGAVNIGSTKTHESEICTNSTPTVQGQHVYEHIVTVTATIKEVAVETHANQAYESVITRKE